METFKAIGKFGIIAKRVKANHKKE